MDKALRSFILTIIASILAWGLIFFILWIAQGRFKIPEIPGAALYILAFYIAPLAFVAGVIGSLVRLAVIVRRKRRPKAKV